jgi:preprotein translocase subunit SecA
MTWVPVSPRPEVDTLARDTAPRPSVDARHLQHPRDKSEALRSQIEARRLPKDAPRNVGISTTRAVSLTLGLEGGLDGRVPLRHLSWLRAVNGLRPKMLAETDAGLRARFDELGARIAKGATIRDVLPEALAVVREASRRALGKEPYDVQILAAAALCDRKLAELKTGEGKTLSAATAAAVLALPRKGVHVATSNGYLAERDAADTKPLFDALGLSLGVAKSWGQSYDEKREAYRADVTYAHADTLAFDFIEDQTWWQRDWRVQRPLNAVIVDEADEVLLDNATCPLVLCGMPETAASFDARKGLLRLADELAARLDRPGFVIIDVERSKARPFLTDEGISELERLVREARGLSSGAEVWTEAQMPLFWSILQSLEARHAVVLGKDYIEADQQLTLVSSGTGRPNPGARLRHGLMDSVLAKESRAPELELQPLGAIGYPAFFSRYARLAGMTGTSHGRRGELAELYGLQTVQIPTNRPSQRVDEPDAFFPSPGPRMLAAVADVLDTHATGQPVLVSTVSVTASKEVAARLAEPRLALVDVAISSPPLFSAACAYVQGGAALLARVGKDAPEDARRAAAPELLAAFRADARGVERFVELLDRAGLPARTLLGRPDGVPHRVLNAETHAEEATIIGAAGQKGAITVATQMAGRGTDIPLAPEVIELGGLRVVGVERKANVRQDAQVRGRAGRQGQPGSSRFYVSLSDEVFTYLPANKLRPLAEKVATSRLDALPDAMRRAYQGALDHAQERAELDDEHTRRMSMRLSTALEASRRYALAWREDVLDSTTLASDLSEWVVEDRLMRASPAFAPEVVRELVAELDPDAPELASPPTSAEGLDAALRAVLERRVTATIAARGEAPDAFNQFLRGVVLARVDQAWLGHVMGEEEAQRTAHLHAYGGRNPFVEHELESGKAFRATMDLTRADVREAFVSVVRNFELIDPPAGVVP